MERGEITGLRTRGGFEIISLKWNNGKIKSAVIKFAIGGNLRLRVHNALMMNGAALAKAEGGNPNFLFGKQEISRSLISEKAPLKGVELKGFYLYDVPTQVGQTYTFVSF